MTRKTENSMGAKEISLCMCRAPRSQKSARAKPAAV